MIRTDHKLVVLDASVNNLVAANPEFLYSVTRWCMDHDINIDHVRRLEETPLGTVRVTYYVLDSQDRLQIDPADSTKPLTATHDLIPTYLLPDPAEKSWA